MNNKKIFSSFKENIKYHFFDLKNKIISQIKKVYLSKKAYYKLAIFLFSAIIILCSSFLIRNSILNAKNDSWILIPNFLEVKIIGNTGIAFSGLASHSASLIYFLQIFPIIFSLIALIFSNSILLDIGLSFLFFGGSSNLIDRMIFDDFKTINVSNTVNSVVDYLKFSENFIKNSAIFNLPDIYIIIGMIFLVISILISWIKDFKNDKSKNKNEENKLLKDDIIVESNQAIKKSLK